MRKFILGKALKALVLAIATTGVTAHADGFPNEPQTPGDRLAGPVAPHMGRLAVIEYIGGKVVTIPEVPSSPAGSDFLVRSWDLSNPRTPIELQSFGRTQHPFLAHGTIKTGNELLIFGFPNNALQANGEQALSHVRWAGPEGHFDRSGMMRPWAARSFWSYGNTSGNAWLDLDGERMASWDHVGQTGVIGHAMFMGNLLIYASDQTNSGVATYDVSDPRNPRLLDVLNDTSIGGIGGYWPEIYGHYVVFPRRTPDPRIQVVDFSDPENLRLHCDIRVPRTSDRPMYANFQDEYAFITKHKVDVEACEIVLEFDNDLPPATMLNQFSMPLGNLVVFGGTGRFDRPNNTAGMSIWAHQAEPDTRGPYVTYHIPKEGQTNYPIQAPISVHIPETLQTETLVPNGNLIVREVGGDNVPFQYVLNHSGMLTIDPIGHLEPQTTYEVVFVEGGILDAANNGMQGHSFRFSTGTSVSNAPTPDPDPDPVPSNQAPTIGSFSIDTESTIQAGSTVTFTASAEDPEGELVEYRFDFADGNGFSQWSASGTASHQFNETGQFRVNLQVRDQNSNTAFDSLNITVLASVNPQNNQAENRFLNSSQLACDTSNEVVWAVNPDNNTVTVLDASDNSRVNEYTVGQEPKSIAISAVGEAWVANRKSDTVTVLNQNGAELDTIELDYGDAPYGIAMSPDGLTAYVSLYGAGEVIAIDVISKDIVSRVEVGPTAAALALSPNGETLLVTRFIADLNWGEVWQIDTDSMTLTGTIRLVKDFGVDTLESGRGVPNYLSGITFSNDGSRAFVVGTKPNVDLSPVFWSGIEGGNDLDDDNTVRTVMATIDMTGPIGEDVYNLRIDFDNADSPTSVTTSANDDFIFVTLQGTNAVFVYDAAQHGTDGNIATFRGRVQTENAPQSLCLTSDNNTLFVKNFTSRSVTRMDLSRFFQNGALNPPTIHTSAVTSEALSPEVLRGKQVFYNASDERMSAEGYISCATCHTDGRDDGRTWDFTGRGEGFRNTTSLLGKGGVRFGAAHWSGNFDEIQDFENDIRNNFLGEGFLTDAQFAASEAPLGAPKAGLNDDLDALAAYLGSLGQASLDRSPNRLSNGDLTAAAIQGQSVFVDQSCQSCHSGNAFTDGQLHDVGTFRNDVGPLGISVSGRRLGEELPGLKTPTLLGLHATAPYLHDGSAATIAQVFETVGGKMYQAEDADFSERRPFLGQIYLRGSQGIAMSGSGRNTLRYADIDGGSGGSSWIRIRYSGSFSAEHNTLEMRVNDERHLVSLELLPRLPEDSTRAGNYTETSSIPVNLREGENNTISFVMTSGDTNTQYVVIDDISVSTPEDIAAADAHTRVSTLPGDQRANLIAYLGQLDTTNAPSDSEDLGIDPSNADQPGFSRDQVPDPTPPSPPEQNDDSAPPVTEPTPEQVSNDVPEEEPEQTAAEPNQGVGSDGLIAGAPNSGGGSAGIFLIGLLSLMVSFRRKR